MDSSKSASQRSRSKLAASEDLSEKRTGAKHSRYAIRVGSLSSTGPDHRRSPTSHLEEVSRSLHDAVGELDDLLFQLDHASPRCQADVHEAIGCIMDALQRLARAQQQLGRVGGSGGTPRLLPHLAALNHLRFSSSLRA
ncbi:MAG: hypothetical protein GC191_07270 [Azospirillum sp.]|nr:hypothetical protein [Azospirillum sp.]